MARELFTIAEVLTITTGKLVAPEGMDAVYRVIGWMTKDKHVTTLGLLAYAKKCKNAILEQYPELIGIKAPSAPESWSDDQLERYYSQWVDLVSREVCRKFYAIAQIDVKYKSDFTIFHEVRTRGVDYSKDY